VTCHPSFVHRFIVLGLPSCWSWRSIGPAWSLEPPSAQLLFDKDGKQYLQTRKEPPRGSSDIDLDEDEEAVASATVDQAAFSPIQFKQLSVGTNLACGIQYLDSKIRCWGNLKNVQGNDLIDSAAPYRQVSVGARGVCMLSEGTNAVSCIGIQSLPQNTEWDQLKVGKHHTCGVTMDSELKCVGPRNAFLSALREDFVVA
jgi:hypothetical protein